MRCHRGVRWLAAGGIAAAFLCGIPTVWAESFTYQGHTLKYAVPPGYCLMDRQGVVGSALYSILEKGLQDDEEFVALYLNCDELTTFMGTHTSPLLHGGVISIPKSGGSVVVRGDETRRDEIDHQVDRFSVIDLGWVNDQLKLRGQERGVVIPELKDLRLVDYDNIAAYAAFMDAKDDQHMPMVSIVAMSLTNQLPFKNVMIAPAGDPNVVQTLLDGQHRYMNWLIAQNETEEQRQQQSRPTPGLLGVGGSLGSGSMLIGALCFFGALWLLIRLLHSRA